MLFVEILGCSWKKMTIVAIARNKILMRSSPKAKPGAAHPPQLLEGRHFIPTEFICEDRIDDNQLLSTQRGKSCLFDPKVNFTEMKCD